MERLVALALWGIFVPTATQNITRPSYLISAPRVLRPGIPTSLSVTILTQTPTRVTAEIYSNNGSLTQTEGTFAGGSTALLVLPPLEPPLPFLNIQKHGNDYTLEVRGYVGDKPAFRNTTTLNFLSKRSSTFIQTDKFNYKPGQTVQIRVISIGLDGKPNKSKVQLVVKDPKGNMIHRWPLLDSFLGVVSTEFLLSDIPPLGMWTLVALANGVESEKQFNVDCYVLPKFDVLLKAPSVIHWEDVLMGTVSAQYTYGKPVRGQMVVTAKLSKYGLLLTANKTDKIDGSATFEFSKINFVESYNNNGKLTNLMTFEEQATGQITASVTETLTGLTYNNTIEVTFVSKRYLLRFYGYPTLLRPSLNFSAFLKISLYDGELVPAMDENVTLTLNQHTYDFWKWKPEHLTAMGEFHIVSEQAMNVTPSVDPMKSIQIMTVSLPADGVIPINIQLLDDVAMFSVEATFHEVSETLRLHNTYTSPTNSYLQLHWAGLQHQQVGMPIELVAQSNFALMELNYVVISRGQVVAAGKKTTASFTLNPDFSWAPFAWVVVYVIHPSGEVINGAIKIPLGEALKNHVSLNWSQASTKPAGKVELKVSVSEPNSLVGILVVDKAAKQGEDDNDLNKDKILKELGDYNLPYGDMMIGDPNSVFMASNLVVLTDAILPRGNFYEDPEFRHMENFMFMHGNNEDGDQAMSPGLLHVRKNFPETWLWLDTNVSMSTTASFSLKAPDSITTWIATAFVISDDLGLGLTNNPAKLTVFQDFFISLNLPPFIIRGEQLVLEVLLFNYLTQNVTVTVTVAESKSFEFAVSEGKDIYTASPRKVSVASDQSTSVLFPITPRVLGEISFSVKAQSSIANDAIVRKVLVKPEGIEQSFTQSMFLELAPSVNRLYREIVFTFPADVVTGSERAQVTVVGDILGPSITGLDSLIQMPSGCGEQNMIYFAPNIYVLQYLNKTSQAKEDIHTKAISYMLKGYQQELSYQRQDGSFSAFGDSDSSGSTWLSAFVLRCFLQARQFIHIDETVISRTVDWLLEQQNPDGSFSEPGRVIHTELQGGLNGNISLTAYVLMALQEEPTYRNMYSSQIASTRHYLETMLDLGITNNYTLSLVAYALSLVNSPKAVTAVNRLLTRAEMNGNVTSWSTLEADLSSSWQPPSVNIEIAAYVLLTLFNQARVEEGISLMKWLCQQRNHLGGYGSTQDTIVALQALSCYATLSGAHAINLKIQVTVAPSQTMANFQIDSTNYLVYQSKEIKTDRTMRVGILMEGRGFALFQMNFFYHVAGGRMSMRGRLATRHEAFALDVEVIEHSDNMDRMILFICTRLLGNQTLSQTGMVLIEVGLLSGFILAEEGVPTSDVIRRVETASGKVIVYFDSVNTSEICIKIPTVRSSKVAHVQDATVLIYDYYEPHRRALRTYNSETMRTMPSCSFCGRDCRLCRSAGAPIPNGSQTPTVCSAYLLLPILMQLIIWGFSHC